MFQIASLVLSRISSVAGDKKGVTAVEYSLLAALIATALIAVLSTFTGDLTTIFTGIGTKLVSST